MEVTGRLLGQERQVKEDGRRMTRVRNPLRLLASMLLEYTTVTFMSVVRGCSWEIEYLFKQISVELGCCRSCTSSIIDASPSPQPPPFSLLCGPHNGALVFASCGGDTMHSFILALAR